MRCDMLVAVGSATAEAESLFGHNCSLPSPQPIELTRVAGRPYAPGEQVLTQFLQLPQARRTWTVLAARPEGHWGYVHGLNEHGLAAGMVTLPLGLAGTGPGLIGTDLVRLVLERCRTAQQAIDLVAECLQQQGMGVPESLRPHGVRDAALLLADPHEAFAVETAGQFWVEQEVSAVRAASEVRVIRQDWDRIAPGFAALAIERGWWPEDGTKLDSAGCLGETCREQNAAWRRWGRATLLLEQQNGNLDLASFRRILADHDEDSPLEIDPRQAVALPPLCQHAAGRGRETTVASLITQVARFENRLALAWWAAGPPCGSVYFPLFLQGELPALLTLAGPPGVGERLQGLHAWAATFPAREAQLAEALERLQARLDQDAEEFAVEGAALQARGEQDQLPHLATAFHHHVAERFEAVADRFPSVQGPHRFVPSHDWAQRN